MKKSIIISSSCILLTLFLYLHKNTYCSQDVFCKGLTPQGLQEKRLTILAENKNAKIIRSLTGKPLVIPVAHIISLKELDNCNVHLLASMLELAAQSSPTLTTLEGPYNHASFHTGPRGGQTVYHLHMHMDHVKTTPNTMPLANLICTIATKYTEIQESKSGQLLIVLHSITKTLDDPQIDAHALSLALLDITNHIKTNHPNKDYATDIYTTTTEQGKPTVVIQVQLY